MFCVSPNILLVLVCVLPAFLPQSKDMHVRLIKDSKWALGISISVTGLSHVSTAIGWQLSVSL